MKRVGVLGTLIWDRIWSLDAVRTGGAPFEDWGGVPYSLASMAAVLPDDWELVPLVKLGRDLAQEADALLRSIPRLRVDDGVIVVPEANNRVDLRYWEADRRCEQLSGGVPPWRWDELASRVAGLDALYVNFITGFEMDLAVAERLRAGFGGPIYADIHSLMLARGEDGKRTLRPLPDWRRWMACFDAVQCNEDELAALADGEADPRGFAAAMVGRGPGLAVVTLAGDGAAFFVRDGFLADPAGWPHHRAPSGAVEGDVQAGTVPLEHGPAHGDPTGCGDVWGGALFAAMLAGRPLDDALRTAHAAAARNVAYSGASGLFDHLAGGATGT